MKKLIALCALLCAASFAHADEGMWTVNNFPSAKVQAKYGFSPNPAWLEHVQRASVRLAGGCSGSFVSPSGLVMTNHHCAHSCIAQLSTAKRDYVQSGFYAKTEAQEVKCPDIEVDQLMSIADVTGQINKATHGLSGAKYNRAEKAEEARLEKECSKGAAKDVRCDVVALYHGGVYNLYHYKRFQDVRLVFAPELDAAFFGGDPDNFNFPRYDLDVSLLRVYDNNKPAAISDYFKWSPSGVKDGELTFTVGNPGHTDRERTVAELEYQKDVALPDRLLTLAQLRGELIGYADRGAEEKRTSATELFYIENSYKALRGELQALDNVAFFNSKIEAENKFRARLAKDPKAKADLAAYDDIARAMGYAKELRMPYAYEERGALAGGSNLFQIARTVVRGAAERPKPNAKRFAEFRDSSLPAVTQRLFSAAPIYKELEIERLRFGLTKMREELGADDPFVKKVLGKQSPTEVATRLVNGTHLADLSVRKALWSGGEKAILASKDPMVELVRHIDADARAVRKRYEDHVEAVVKKNSERIARAHFATEGTSTYPDATFTLRISYGQVKGYEDNGHLVKPLTTFAGAFARATGAEPFALPASWETAKPKLNLSTPLDFCSTNDIIGGNSGSPVIDKDAQIVGLIFDGNIESLGGDYGFDAAVNRAVAVDSAALIQAFSKIYHADRIVHELQPPHLPASTH